MTRFARQSFAVALSVWLGGAAGLRAAETNAPDFREIYDLVRAHLAGASDAELSRAAVDGLLTELRGKVRIVGSETLVPETNAPLIAKSTVLDDGVGYVRIAKVAASLADDLRAAYQKLSSTNKVKGLALDLRFADGDDYASAAATADLFIAKERPLLDWGNGVVKSPENKNALTLPVAVLVNRETGGAAEALAAVLREAGVGLLLGGTTAGRAMISQEFPLHDGQRLRIAATPVKLGNGTALSGRGVTPDIEVTVSVSAERAYLGNEYAVLPESSRTAAARTLPVASVGVTNRPPRPPPMTEAELVREHREGTNRQIGAAATRPAEPEAPSIRDPVLARAVDLLKGLALVRQSPSK